MINWPKGRPMNEEIISAGLSEDSISSRVTLGSTLVAETAGSKQDDIAIPHRYWRNSLKILPVNVKTVFVYWEITSDLMASRDAAFPLILKISDESELSELMRFGVFEEIGSSYVNAYWNEKSLAAELGYLNEFGEFIPLLSSNKLVMPSDRLHITTGEGQTWMSKFESFEEIIKASMEQDMPTSSSIMRQMQLAFYDARLNSLSSFSITK